MKWQSRGVFQGSRICVQPLGLHGSPQRSVDTARGARRGPAAQPGSALPAELRPVKNSAAGHPARLSPRQSSKWRRQGNRRPCSGVSFNPSKSLLGPSHPGLRTRCPPGSVPPAPRCSGLPAAGGPLPWPSGLSPTLARAPSRSNSVDLWLRKKPFLCR